VNLAERRAEGTAERTVIPRAIETRTEQTSRPGGAPVPPVPSAPAPIPFTRPLTSPPRLGDLPAPLEPVRVQRPAEPARTRPAWAGPVLDLMA
jgi:hypothetical protein